MRGGSKGAYNEGQRVPDHCQQLNDEAKQRQDQAAQLHMDKKRISSAPQFVHIESILEAALAKEHRHCWKSYASMVERKMASPAETRKLKAARTSQNAMQQQRCAP